MMITTATEDSSNDIRHGDCLRPFEIVIVFDTPGAADYGLASKKLSLLGTFRSSPQSKLQTHHPYMPMYDLKKPFFCDKHHIGTRLTGREFAFGFS
jgi:hypothetical protein